MKKINQQQVNNQPAPIKTIEDLQAEIRNIKTGLKPMEQDIEDRLRRLPQETIKSTLGAVLPAFVNTAVASTTWGLVQNAGTLLLSNSVKGKGGIKSILASTLKQAGLIAGLKAIYTIWKKRKNT